jgi:hypothetical protein
MDKFIEFNGSIFNIRHIIAVCKCKRDRSPQYGIALHVTGDVERQHFDNEDARNAVFNQLSNQLLNM